MSIDEFWNIVDRVHAAAPDDMDTKCRLLADELRRLSPSEVLSFENHFGDCFWQSNTWHIWGAAHVIKGACGDDSFMDFRSTLISLGRTPFEAAIANVDSLADFNINPAWAAYEGYQYVTLEVLGEMFGDEVLSRQDTKRRSRRTRGVEFVEWEMSKRFPKLVAKYEYKDSDWLVGKEIAARLAKKERAAAKLKKIMLEAGIIPSSGLIPPPRVVAQVLQTGRSPESAHRQHNWKPFDFDEGYYWRAVSRLEKLSPAELKSRPDLQGVKLTLDLGVPDVVSFDDWMRTLSDRGLG